MSSVNPTKLGVLGGVVLITALCAWFGQALGPFAKYPADWVVPLESLLNFLMDSFIALFKPGFLAIGRLLEFPIGAVRLILEVTPWFTVFALTSYAAWRVSGAALSAFAGLSMLYMVAIGYWQESMNTFSLIAISVPLAVGVGFAVGCWGFLSDRANRVIMPLLDLFQTIPAFAYLLPLLLLFGFGTAVGLIASVLFSFPPMVRNTILGLRAVPTDMIESGLMSGGTSSQIFWKVRVPAARKQILLGVNQATMASLSMVIIASVIGGTNDIGWAVLSTMRRADFGSSLLAGLVIALMAMVLDRFTWSVATKSISVSNIADGTWWQAGIVPTALLLGTVLAEWLMPSLSEWPRAWVLRPSDMINQVLDWWVAESRIVLDAIKSGAFFFIMLPAKIGLAQAVSPYTWGFSMTPGVTLVYAAFILSLAGMAMWRGRIIGSIWLVVLGMVLFRGLVNMPWLAFMVLLPALVWQICGLRLAAWTFAGQVFLLLSGLWEPAMLSIYLCGIGALIAFILGGLIGTLAAESDRFSAVVRPIIDTLQTMPLFVILIPYVMIFRIGEFTALLAIITYAIVPAIRYTEHGLRNQPEGVMEAAIAMGTTRWQRLFRVKMPLAKSSILLGINQTIMFSISMLVITALVGTSDLGQEIYPTFPKWPAA